MHSSKIIKQIENEIEELKQEIEKLENKQYIYLNGENSEVKDNYHDK